MMDFRTNMMVAILLNIRKGPRQKANTLYKFFFKSWEADHACEYRHVTSGYDHVTMCITFVCDTELIFQIFRAHTRK